MFADAVLLQGGTCVRKIPESRSPQPDRIEAADWLQSCPDRCLPADSKKCCCYRVHTAQIVCRYRIDITLVMKIASMSIQHHAKLLPVTARKASSHILLRICQLDFPKAQFSFEPTREVMPQTGVSLRKGESSESGGAVLVAAQKFLPGGLVSACMLVGGKVRHVQNIQPQRGYFDAPSGSRRCLRTFGSRLQEK